MGAKRMRTSRKQLIEEPATLADRTANGAGAQCERVPALEEAARNAAMYLATGFITCPRCGEDVETKNTDAEYTLRAALSSQEPSAHRETVLYEAARKTQKAIAAILASGGLESDKWWDDLVSAQQSLAAAIRSLSSPDHNADAGKVEGDGWKPIGSAPKDGTHFLAWGSWKQEEPAFIAIACRFGEEPGRSTGWWVSGVTPFYPRKWRPLPSAPSQEVAGS